MEKQLETISQVKSTLVDPAVRFGPRVLAAILIKPWVSVDDFGPATGEINKAIVEVFRARQIVIPVPQREIRMLQS